MNTLFVTNRTSTDWTSANSTPEAPTSEPEVQPKPEVLPPAPTEPIPFEKPSPDAIPESPEPVPLPVESEPTRRTDPLREEETLPFVEKPRKGCG